MELDVVHQEHKVIALKEEDIARIVSECEDAFADIPFGNSKFQIENFVINSQYTPERAYRAIGLAVSSRIRALKEAYFNLKKEEIDIDELEWKIVQKSTSEWDKRRFTIEIEEKNENKEYTKKLINDALHELSAHYEVFKKMPRYTREQFEDGERKHFEIRLSREAQGIIGAVDSLDCMGVDLESLSKEQACIGDDKVTGILEGLLLDGKI